MASLKITQLTDYAGGQGPDDLAYIGASPFGLTDDRKSTLDDLFATITKNITDGAIRFQGFSAPSLSAAGQGSIYFDSTLNRFRVSQNGGAYTDLIAGPAGSNKQVQFNDAGVFGGAAGFEYQSGASPNVSITAQDDAHTALLVKPASDSYTLVPFKVTGSTLGARLEFDPVFNVNLENLSVLGYDGASIGVYGASASTGFAYVTVGVVPGTNTYLYISANGSALPGSNLSNIANSGVLKAGTSTTGGLYFINSALTGPIVFASGGQAATNERLRIDANGNIVAGRTALAAAASDGFLYLPFVSANAEPTGTPTSYTGLGALVLENDTLNDEYRLWGYLNGAWRNLTSGGITGSGAANQVTYWTGATTISGDNNFTWNPSTRFLNIAPATIISTQLASTSGIPPKGLNLIGGAHTNVPAGNDVQDVIFDLGRTITWQTGAVATNRTFQIQAPTLAFAAASTVTQAVTLSVNSPVAGANATLTESAVARFATSNAAHIGLIIDYQLTATGDFLKMRINSNDLVRFDGAGNTINSVFGNAALAAAATDGFVYLPYVASDAEPSGTPTTYTGMGPIVLENDTSAGEYRMWAYLNGAWRNLSGGGGVSGGGTAPRLTYWNPTNTVDDVIGSSVTTDGFITIGGQAATSGTPTLFTITGPAHTGLATAEATDVYFNLARTVTLTTSVPATWRAFRIDPPTIASGTAGIITTAATVAITGEVGAGANVSITNHYALHVTGRNYFTYPGANAGGANDRVATFDSASGGAGTAVGIATSSTLRSLWYVDQFNNTYFIPTGTGNVCYLGVAFGAVGSSIDQVWLGGTAFGAGIHINTNLTVAIRDGATAATNAQLHVSTGDASLPCFRMDSAAAGSTVAILHAFNVADDTTTVADIALWSGRSSGTTGNGFGQRTLYQLQTTTTADLDAAAKTVLWTNATNASQSAAYVLSIVDNAAALAEKWRISGNGAATGTLETQTAVNGSSQVRGQITENVTLSTSGATTDSTIDLPANSIILSVTARVTTTIAGVDSTDLQIGDPTTATRFGSGTTLTAGATIVGLNHMQGGVTTDAAGPVQTSAAKVRITLTGGADNTPSAGAIRISIHYIQFIAPTS